jgi:hypothetical protein
MPVCYYIQHLVAAGTCPCAIIYSSWWQAQQGVNCIYNAKHTWPAICSTWRWARVPVASRMWPYGILYSTWRWARVPVASRHVPVCYYMQHLALGTRARSQQARARVLLCTALGAGHASLYESSQQKKSEHNPQCTLIVCMAQKGFGTKHKCQSNSARPQMNVFFCTICDN